MKNKSSPKIIVGMPAYNEAKYIGSLVLQSRQYAEEVIVVDDGSHDQTSHVARLASAIVVRHEQNMGYGTTIQTIFAEARERNADILVILDADSQHNPEEIPTLIKGISEGFDIVVGSREMHANVIPFYRRMGQKLLSRLTGVASQTKLSDTESGFRAYSKKAISSIELKETGMAVSSEIVSEATAKDLKIIEVPISVVYTKDGSTLNPVRHGAGLLGRILVMISERRPLFFFGLSGGILLILGLAVGIVVIRAFYFDTGILATGSALISMLLITVGLLTVFTGIILNILVRRISDRR